MTRQRRTFLGHKSAEFDFDISSLEFYSSAVPSKDFSKRST